MIEKNDWRLQGQEKYLTNRKLMRIPYFRWSKTWDHDHCDFCFATFSEYDGDLHEGYVTADNCVTVRDRDTMEQVRIPIAELKSYIEAKIAY